MELHPSDDTTQHQSDDESKTKESADKRVVPPTAALGVTVDKPKPLSRTNDNSSFFDMFLREKQFIHDQEAARRRALGLDGLTDVVAEEQAPDEEDAENDDEATDSPDEEQGESAEQPQPVVENILRPAPHLTAEQIAANQSAEIHEEPIVSDEVTVSEEQSQNVERSELQTEATPHTDDSPAPHNELPQLIQSRPTVAELEPLQIIDDKEILGFEDVPFVPPSAAQEQPSMSRPARTVAADTLGDEPLDIWEMAAHDAGSGNIPPPPLSNPGASAEMPEPPRRRSLFRRVPFVYPITRATETSINATNAAVKTTAAETVSVAAANTAGAALVGGIAGWYLGRRTLKTELQKYRAQADKQQKEIAALEQDIDRAEASREQAVREQLAHPANNEVIPIVTPSPEKPAQQSYQEALRRYHTGVEHYRQSEQAPSSQIALSESFDVITTAAREPALESLPQSERYRPAAAVSSEAVEPSVNLFEATLAAPFAAKLDAREAQSRPQPVSQTEKPIAPAMRQSSEGELARHQEEQVSKPETPVRTTSSWHAIEVDPRTGRAIENQASLYGQEFHNEQRAELLQPATSQSNNSNTTVASQSASIASSSQAVASLGTTLPQPAVSQTVTEGMVFDSDQNGSQNVLHRIPGEVADNLRSPIFWMMAAVVVLGVLLFSF